MPIVQLGSDKTNQPFGDAVRSLLQEQKRSQNSLSKELGLSKGQLSRMLNVKRTLSTSRMEAIAAALGKPSSYFVELRVLRIADYLRQNEARREELWDELSIDRS